MNSNSLKISKLRPKTLALEKADLIGRISIKLFLSALKTEREVQLGWLSRLKVILCAKGLLVRFLVRTHTETYGTYRKQWMDLSHIDASLPLSKHVLRGLNTQTKTLEREDRTSNK